MIDVRNFFDQSIKYEPKRMEILQKLLHTMKLIAGLIVYHSYFKENYKLTAINVSKQQALDADPKMI